MVIMFTRRSSRTHERSYEESDLKAKQWISNCPTLSKIPVENVYGNSRGGFIVGQDRHTRSKEETLTGGNSV